MKTSALALIAALGCAALAGCASDYADGPYGAYGAVDVGGYYDGYFGPYPGGYWGPQGYFYYYDGGRGRYHRDHDHHFRHDPASGYQHFQGRAPNDVPHRSGWPLGHGSGHGGGQVGTPPGGGQTPRH
jgi:hypothetical protein